MITSDNGGNRGERIREVAPKETYVAQALVVAAVQAVSGPGMDFIRDACSREDESRVRTPLRRLASSRNLAVNALRLAGRTDVTGRTNRKSPGHSRISALPEGR
ncbi:hypothetical protein [Actinoplanes xinjiangensis]|uniref:hypothetical protein n=1 Tax=Actinoplanes xinjiangensis TaxID=512350 RepID=UPI003443858C